MGSDSDESDDVDGMGRVRKKLFLEDDGLYSSQDEPMKGKPSQKASSEERKKRSLSKSESEEEAHKKKTKSILVRNLRFWNGLIRNVLIGFIWKLCVDRLIGRLFFNLSY